MQQKSHRKKAGNEAEVRRVDTGQAVYMTPWFQVWAIGSALVGDSTEWLYGYFYWLLLFYATFMPLWQCAHYITVTLQLRLKQMNSTFRW